MVGRFKKILIAIVVVLQAVFVLSGCSQKDNLLSKPSENITEAVLYEGDWREEGFPLEQAVTDGQMNAMENPPYHEKTYRLFEDTRPEYAYDSETIAKFLEYALSTEAQRNCLTGSVRRDSIRAQVSVHEFTGEYVYGSGKQSLVTKEDGSTYLEEYLEYLEQCAPLPRSYEEIEDIVLTEVEAFFSGNQTAQQVAEIIDNRVQLYFDEQK